MEEQVDVIVEYKWFSTDDIRRILQENLPAEASVKEGPETFGAAWHHVFKNVFPEIYTT